MDSLLLDLSAKFVHTKFVRAKATDAIPNYPDEKCPTLLVYKAGRVLKQFVSLDAFAGRKTDGGDLEWELSKTGAIRTDMTEAPARRDQRFKLHRSNV
jgi:Phosducin